LPPWASRLRARRPMECRAVESMGWEVGVRARFPILKRGQRYVDDHPPS
jgi:hypothetical protein